MNAVGKTAMNDPGVPQTQVAAEGSPSRNKDTGEAATAPKFGDVLKNIQAKYGEQAQKPREIKKTLGKDDFLRIMISQMKNQDPTNPFKAEQMATEIAQFTSVEQLQNMNQSLKNMASQNKPIENMAMTNLIGKMVTVDRERFPHQQGQSDTLNFSLSRNASTVKLSVINEAGEAILEKDMGAQKQGDVNFAWDGLQANTLPAKSGTYLYRVDAKDDRGQTIQINPKVRAKVVGVSFEGNDPVFLVGDAKHQDRVTMRNITQIEIAADAQGSEVNAGNSWAGAAPAAPVDQPLAQAPAQNFFTFQKGVGSAPIAQTSESKALRDFRAQQEILKAQQEARAKQVAQEGLSDASGEKGFPNGLEEAK